VASRDGARVVRTSGEAPLGAAGELARRLADEALGRGAAELLR
jgi:hypothetical protein